MATRDMGFRQQHEGAAGAIQEQAAARGPGRPEFAQ